MTKTLVGLVVDRSGSMAVVAQDTVTGYNAFIDAQRFVEGECRVSLMLFDDRQDVLHIAEDVAEVPELTLQRYAPNGSTALLDSFAMMIEGLAAWAEDHSWDGDIKVVTLTDGAENASTHYSRERVNGLIAEKQAAGWEFIFLGSGGSAWLEGTSMASLAPTSYSVGVGGAAMAGAWDATSVALKRSRRRGTPMSATYAERYAPGPDAPEAPAQPKSSTVDKLRDQT